jgi:hypothetical protein
VEIPDVTVLKFSTRYRTDKIILSQPIHIKDHPMWYEKDICLKAVEINGHALELVKEQTPKLCLAANKQNTNASRYLSKRKTNPQVHSMMVYRDGC